MTQKEYFKAIEINNQMRYCGDMLAYLTHNGWVWDQPNNPTASHLRNIFSTFDEEMRGTLIQYYANKLELLQEEQAQLTNN